MEEMPGRFCSNHVFTSDFPPEHYKTLHCKLDKLWLSQRRLSSNESSIRLPIDEKKVPASIGNKDLTFQEYDSRANFKSCNYGTIQSDGIVIDRGVRSPSPAPERTKRETGRLASFENYNGNVSAWVLAANGFYYKGPGDRVKCFSCLECVENLEITDDMSDWHATNCLFIMQEINKKRIDGGMDSPWRKTKSCNYYGTIQSDGIVIDRGVRSPSPAPERTKRETARLASFKNYNGNVSAWVLAANGFYYKGPGDRVKCFSCLQCVENLEVADDMSSTDWHSADCAFMHKNSAENVSIEDISEEPPSLSARSPGPSLSTRGHHDDEHGARSMMMNRSRPPKPSNQPSSLQVRGVATVPQKHRFATSFAANKLPPAKVQSRGLPTVITAHAGQAPALNRRAPPPISSGAREEQDENADDARTPPTLHPVTQPNQQLHRSTMSAFSQPAPSAADPVQVRPLLQIAQVPDPQYEARLYRLNLYNESCRLETFQDWPMRFPTVASLARSGFFYLGNLDRAQCFSCCKVFKNWRITDDADEIHRKYSPDCRMVHGEEKWNEPTPEFRSSAVAQPPPGFAMPSNPASEVAPSNSLTAQYQPASSSQQQPSQQQPSSPHQQPSSLPQQPSSPQQQPHTQWRQEQNGYVTSYQPTSPTNDPPSSSFQLQSTSTGHVTPTFPHRRTDSVYATLEISSQSLPVLEPTPAVPPTPPVPVVANVVSPAPSYLRESLRDLDPLSPTPAAAEVVFGTSTQIAEEQESDEEAGEDGLDPDLDMWSGDMSRSDANFYREIYPCHEPINPNMRPLRARVASFLPSRWSYPAPSEQVARAGFYHQGVRDHVKCWYCGVVLRDWIHTSGATEAVNPWLEHALMYPSCQYLLRNRGPDFVQDALAASAMEEEEQPGSYVGGQTTYEGGPTVYGNESPPPQRFASSVESGPERLPAFVADPREQEVQDREELERSMGSQMVADALRLGFERRRIVRLLKQQIAEHGCSFQTLDALLDDLGSADDNLIELYSDDDEPGEATQQHHHHHATLAPPSPRASSAPAPPPPPVQSAPSVAASAAATRRTGVGEAPRTGPETSSVEDDLRLRSELQRLRDERRCKVCLDRPAQMVFVPCGHLCCCRECTNALRLCPVCRRPISKSYMAQM